MVIKNSEGPRILASLQLHENQSDANKNPGERHHVLYKPGTIVEDAE